MEVAAYTFDVLRRKLTSGRAAYLTSLRKGLKRATKTRRADLWAEMWVIEAFANLPEPPRSEGDCAAVATWMQGNYPNLYYAENRKFHKASRYDIQAMIDGGEAGSRIYVRPGIHASGGQQARIGGCGTMRTDSI